MKVIFCKWKSICEKGITNAMKRLGISVVDFIHENESLDYDTAYAQKLIEVCHANPDTGFVFTVNFQPIVARTCKILNIYMQ